MFESESLSSFSLELRILPNTVFVSVCLLVYLTLCVCVSTSLSLPLLFPFYTSSLFLLFACYRYPCLSSFLSLFSLSYYFTSFSIFCFCVFVSVFLCLFVCLFMCPSDSFCLPICLYLCFSLTVSLSVALSRTYLHLLLSSFPTRSNASVYQELISACAL